MLVARLRGLSTITPHVDCALTESEQNTEQAENAVEHMCFLTDVNQLYFHALGLYDLELTLLVAQQAQRVSNPETAKYCICSHIQDPREYLPFLRKLQQLPDLRKRFEIDNYLGRFVKALKHLHALGAFDELQAYAIRHTLYKEALDAYKYQPEQLRSMTNIYADYLNDQSKYKEAAIGKCAISSRSTLTSTAYESLSLYENSYKCYHLAHCWRESLYCALMAPLSEEAMTAHATTLASTLTEESRDYISAAHIHAEHLHDIPTAARLLCRGAQFGDATRLLALNGKQALIADIVDTGLADAMGSTTDLLADFRSQLNAQVPRIRELRVRRTTDPLTFFGGDPSGETGGMDIPDNVSLAPTEATTLAGRSMFTRYTGKTASSRQTSRTRRREERKRAKGKKGTVYEEEYLVNSVRRLLERVNSTVSEVENLVDALLRRAMRERAAAIERTLHEVLKLCHECREEVFEAASVSETTGAKADDRVGESVEETLKPHGAEGVFMDSLSTLGSGKDREPPVVKEMKKSALLS